MVLDLSSSPPVRLHHGEALEVLASLKTGAVEAVLTDPPYGTGHWRRPESGQGADPRAVYGREPWDSWSLAWLPEALRVARGPVLFFLPQDRLEEALAFARERGLPFRLLIWGKPDPRPRPQGPAYAFEPVLALRGLPGRGKDLFLATSPRPGRDGEAHGPSPPEAGERHGLASGAGLEARGHPPGPLHGLREHGRGGGGPGPGFLGVEREASWLQVAERRLRSALLQAPLLEAPRRGEARPEGEGLEGPSPLPSPLPSRPRTRRKAAKSGKRRQKAVLEAAKGGGHAAEGERKRSALGPYPKPTAIVWRDRIPV
jgi:site-specific DNA-methyltransferase (adenine-specific)